LPKSAELARRAIAQQKRNWLAWLWYYDVLRSLGAPAAEQRAALAHATEIAPNEERVLSAVRTLSDGDLN
jgi:hypothetical protein